MKSSNFVFAIVVLLCMSFAPSISMSAEGWVDIKDPNELRALYSNKTFKGSGWVGHYRDDGKGVLTPDGGRPQPRTWEVKGDDQVCVAREDGAASCMHFQRRSDNQNVVRVTIIGSGKTFDFTVEDGIPKF